MDLIGVRYHGLPVAVPAGDRQGDLGEWLAVLFLFPSENRFLLLFSSDPHCTYFESREELPWVLTCVS